MASCPGADAGTLRNAERLIGIAALPTMRGHLMSVDSPRLGRFGRLELHSVPCFTAKHYGISAGARVGLTDHSIMPRTAPAAHVHEATDRFARRPIRRRRGPPRPSLERNKRPPRVSPGAAISVWPSGLTPAVPVTHASLRGGHGLTGRRRQAPTGLVRRSRRLDPRFRARLFGHPNQPERSPRRQRLDPLGWLGQPQSDHQCGFECLIRSFSSPAALYAIAIWASGSDLHTSRTRSAAAPRRVRVACGALDSHPLSPRPQRMVPFPGPGPVAWGPVHEPDLAPFQVVPSRHARRRHRLGPWSRGRRGYRRPLPARPRPRPGRTPLVLASASFIAWRKSIAPSALPASACHRAAA